MNEQAKVGLVVLLAAALLLSAIFAIANLHLGGNYVNYKTYFKFGGGLEAGAPVRFAGLKVGRINAVRVDPKDPTRVEVDVEVEAATPIRTDSSATITALGLISENYLEITPGKSTTNLQPGGTIPSVELLDLNALMRKMSELADASKPLIADLQKNLNLISAKADILLTQMNDVTGDANRKYFAGVLKETDGMLKQNSPKIDTITTNFSKASGDLEPLMADLREATAKIQKVLDNANGMVGENREPLKASIAELEKTLQSTRATVEQVQSTLVSNNDNMDILLDNFRIISDNFKEFSDTVKQRPFSLVRIKPLPDRQPPGAAAPSKKKGANKVGN